MSSWSLSSLLDPSLPNKDNPSFHLAMDNLIRNTDRLFHHPVFLATFSISFLVFYFWITNPANYQTIKHMGQSVDDQAQLRADIRTQFETVGIYSPSSLANLINEELDFPQSAIFIEYGKFPSGILNLEILRCWTGLVIEPDANIHRMNRETRSNLYLINTCLKNMTQPQSQTDTINENDDENRDAKMDVGLRRNSTCYPLENYIAALNRTRLDYFALNIPEYSLSLLETFQFYRYKIDLISVVYKSDSTDATLGRLKLLRKLFLRLGYRERFVWSSVATVDAAEKDAKGTAVFFKRIL